MPSTTVPDMLLAMLAEQPIESIFKAQNDLLARHGRFATDGALRVQLHRLVASGAAVRYAQGCYCLPGREPKPVDLRTWVLDELRALWPDAPDVTVLRKRFKRQNRYAPTVLEMEDACFKLSSEGLLARFGGGGFAYASRPAIKLA